MEVGDKLFLKRAFVFPDFFLLSFVKRLVFFAVDRFSVDDRIENQTVFGRTQREIEFCRLCFEFVIAFLHRVTVTLGDFGAQPFEILAFHLPRDLFDEPFQQLIHILDELFAASRLHEKHFRRIVILEVEDIKDIVRNGKMFCQIFYIFDNIGGFSASRIACDIDVKPFFLYIHSEIESLEPPFLERKQGNRLDFLGRFTFVFGKFRVISQFFRFQFLGFKLHFFLL